MSNQPILKFEGQYRFLSNFWFAQVQLDGVYYPSVEHAYQAAKTLDPELRKPFYGPDTSAGDAKRMGKELAIRPDWNEVRLGIMEDLVRQKFEHSILQNRLLSTAPGMLIEGNYWHDQFWGDCNCVKHKDIPGENNLGKILMKVRDEHLGAVASNYV